MNRVLACLLFLLVACKPSGPTTPVRISIEDLRARAAENPNDITHVRRVALAELFAPDGDPARAREAITRGLALAPSDVMLHFAHGEEAILHGRPTEATEALLEAISRARTSSDPRDAVVAEAAVDVLSGAITSHRQPDTITTPLVALLDAPGRLGPAVTHEIAQVATAFAYKRGDVAAVAALAERAGCVTSFRVAGPFGPRDLLGFDRNLGPEASGPLAETYDLGPMRGRRETRTVEGRGCSVHLGDGPVGGGGVTFAEGSVSIGTAGERWIRLETPNAVELFVDGTSVARFDARRSPLVRTRYVPVRFSAGTHEITVKITTRHANPVLIVAVTGDDGRPDAAAGAGFDPAMPEPTEPGDAFVRATVEETRGAVVDARETLDAATWEGDAGVPALVLRAAIALEDPFRPQDASRDEARRLLRRAREKDPASWYARLALAQLAAAEGRDQEAIAEIREAATVWPELVVFPLTLVEMLQARGWDAEADRYVARAVEIFPESCSVIEAERAVAGRLDQMERYIERSEALVACSARSRARLDYLMDARRWDAALAEVDRLAALEPAHVRPRYDATRADIAAGRGDIATARALRARVATLFPRADGYVGDLVDQAIAEGQRDRAFTAIDRALAAEPIAMAGLRILRTNLGGQDDFADYRLDGAAVLRAFEASGRRYEQPEVLVLDYAVHRIFEDGSALHYVHQISRIQSEEAVDSQGEFSPPEGGIMLRLHTIKADGTRLEPDIIAGKETISMPNLEVGDYVEWEYVRVIGPADGLEGAVLGDRFFFQGFETPYDRSELVVVLPASMQATIDPRGNLPPPVETRAGDLRVLRFRVDQSLPLTREPLSVNAREFLPSVNIGIGASWDQLRESFADILADRSIEDPAARRLVEGLVAELPRRATDLDRARLLYAWTLANIEPADNVFGAAPLMLAGRSGSRARVLHYLYELAGIDADLVVVRTVGADQTVSPLPDDETYSTLLVRIGPADAPIYISTNQRGTPFGYTAPAVRGQDALELAADGGIVRIPETTVVEDRRTIDLDAQLAADGSARIVVTETFTGMPAIGWRTDLEGVPAAVLEERFEAAYVARMFPGAELTSLDIDGREENEGPLVMRYAFEIASLGHRERDDFILPGLFPTLLAPTYAMVPERTTTQIVAGADIVTTLRIHLPGGATVTSPPEPATVQGPGGARYTSTVRVDGGALVIERRVDVDLMRVSPEAYPELARFCRQADQAEGRAIRIRLGR